MQNKVYLYVNNQKQEAVNISSQIKSALIDYGYAIVNNIYDSDIVIGFGGDGTLLHFLKQSNYNITSSYIGVNCGTLGFLQDFNVTDVNEFVKEFPNYIKQKLRFIEIEIESENNCILFKALNEFTIQDENDKTFRTKIHIQNEFLEDYVGTGMIFSTPTGSTALNYSAGGSIIHSNIEVLQITPREATANCKMHCLSKSLCIPKGFEISLTPTNTSTVKIYGDAERIYCGKYDKIRIRFSNEYLIKLSKNKDNFIKTIREKML